MLIPDVSCVLGASLSVHFDCVSRLPRFAFALLLTCSGVSMGCSHPAGLLALVSQQSAVALFGIVGFPDKAL